MKKSIMYFILILTFSSCFQSKTIRVVDNYFVGKLGDNNTNWLFFGITEKCENGEGIMAGVESLGYNNEFIIIKCSLAKFYIIPYKKNNKPYFDKKFLIGPLDEDAFLKKKEELHIEDIEFTINP
jgi:hypothetical protein